MIDMLAKRGYQICQMNVIITFLYGFLNEEVYTI